MASNIEVLARGVLVHQGRVLLATPLNETYTYLPGGHVEFGEPAAQALRRELVEELGVEATVDSFIGVVEGAFNDNGRRHAEINLIFRLVCPALQSDQAPLSRESHIAFCWQPLDNLAGVHLLPEVLCQCLPQWLAEGRIGGWASTFEEEP